MSWGIGLGGGSRSRSFEKALRFIGGFPSDGWGCIRSPERQDFLWAASTFGGTYRSLNHHVAVEHASVIAEDRSAALAQGAGDWRWERRSSAETLRYAAVRPCLRGPRTQSV